MWGACKGEVGRYNVVTGQEKHYWVYPQNRYGHDPDDIKFRFPRQTVVYVSPHDSRVIYQASHVLHRSMDEGITWDIISPDLTAHEAEYQIVPGNPITRDVTGEEVYSSIYSMVESRLEKGVIWVGANDGPVSVTRDNGKTWKRVTPPGARGRAHPDHRGLAAPKGRAYIAAYRYMREHDLKPYIYRTDDYGETWTLLTDGKNGIPVDHPTRVVREDTEAARPALRGHRVRGVRVLRRGQALAAAAAEPARHAGDRHQGPPQRPRRLDDGPVAVDHGRHHAAAAAGRDRHGQPAGHRAATTAATARGRPRGAQGLAARPSRCSSRVKPRGIATRPIPPRPGSRSTSAAARIRSLLHERARGGHDPAGHRRARPGAPHLEGAARAARLRRRVAAGSSASPRARPGLKPDAGMQRITWDLRYPGPWAPNAPEGGFGGPMVPPGKYTVKLTTGGQTITRTFDVKSDPRIAGDGVTDADLAEQVKFQLQVRDALSDARKLQQQIEEAMQKAGVKPVPPAGPGATPANTKYDHPLQQLWAQVVTTPGIYTQGMLIDQLQNVQRMITQADQKVGKDAYDRYADLAKELASLEAQLKKITGS